MSKEFKVIVRTFRGYDVAPREKAIKMAKAMINEIIEDGFPTENQWAQFIHEDTKENLGMVHVTCGVLEALDLDNRICTLKALLDK